MSGSLNGGSIRILWDADDSAEVTITNTTGAGVSFTVNGSAVTFPYTLSASTTFTTEQSGRYEVSVTHHGIEIADTPDGTRFVNVRGGSQEVFAPSPDATPTQGFLEDLNTALSATFVGQADRGALLPFKVALSNVTAEPANILVIGDSLGEGSQTTHISYRWADRLRDRLRRDYPVPGVEPGAPTSFIPSWYFASVTGPAFTLSRSFTKPASFGPGRRTVLLDTAGDNMSITVEAESIRVMYVSNGATFTVAVDGGAPVAYSTALPGSNTDGSLTEVIDLGGAGPHDVVLAWDSGALYIDGIIVHNGDQDAGVRVWDASRGGARVQDLVNGGAKRTAVQQWTATLDPSLAVIAFGINDRHADIPPTGDFKTHMEYLIADVRAGVPGVPILLLGQHESGGTFLYQPQEYRDVLEGIAAGDPQTAYLDMSAHMPAVVGDTLALYAEDQVHPVDRGYGLYAEVIVDYLRRVIA